MTLHPEVLARPQRAALSSLGPVLHGAEFYLAGGTAVALHLGHRRSVDLDWFSSRAMGDPLLFAGRLQTEGIPFAVSESAPGSLHGIVRSTHVSLLEYRFSLIGPLESWADYGLEIASLDDLAAMKLSAIAQPGAKKDFVDIYALVTQHRPLQELLETYRRKYGIANIAHVLYGLTYTEDADRQRMPAMLWPVDWRHIKRSIYTWVRDLAR